MVSVQYDTVVSRFGTFSIRVSGAIGYVAMLEIFVLLLNHEGEPMDITQALVCTMVCKLNAGEHLNQSNHYKQKVKV